MSNTAFGILKSGYVAHDTFVHRLDGRTKFLFFLWISLFNYVFYDLYVTAVSLALVLMLAFLARIQKFVLTILVIIVLPIFLLGMGIIAGPFGFAANKTVIASVQILGFTIGFYLEGTVYVAVWTSRLAVTITAALLAYVTTHPSDLAAVMLKSRVPYKFAYAFLATIQLIPILTNEISTIYQAQVSRGLNVQAKLVDRFKSIVVLMIPLTLGAINQTQIRAIALESRGFTAPVKKVMLRDPRLRASDYAVTLIIAVVTCVFIYLILTRGLVPFMVGVQYVRPGG